MPERLLLNEHEAADLLGMSVHWMRKGRYEGFGPNVTRVGSRAVRYDYADIIAFRDQCKEGALA